MKYLVVLIMLWLPGSAVFAFAPADSSKPEQVINRLDVLADKYQLTTPTGRTITSSIKILRSQLVKLKAAMRKAEK